MGLTVERTIRVNESESEVAQSCLTLYHPIDCSPRNFPGKSTGVGCHFLLQSRQEYWSGLPFPSGDLPDPGIKPGSLALHTEALPLCHQGSPNCTLIKTKKEKKTVSCNCVPNFNPALSMC